MPSLLLRWRRSGALETAACLILASAALLISPLNSDAGYVLVAARRLITGERLYVDLIETNTPLIFWLMTVPARAGSLVGWSDARLVALFTIAVLWLAALCAGTLLARIPEPARPLRSLIISGYCLAAVFVAITQVGQREQLAVLLLLPQSVLAARTIAGLDTSTRLRLATGAMAGVGIAIKPFFAAPWIAMEAMIVATRGWKSVARLDVAVIVLLQVGHGLAMLAFHREYFERIVPMVGEWYGAYATPRAGLLTSGRVLVLLGASLAALIWPRWLPPSFAAACARAFGAATLGWLVSYVVQAKGWGYQLLPAEVSATAAMAALGIALVTVSVSGVAARGWLDRAVAWTLIAAALGAGALLVRERLGRTQSAVFAGLQTTVERHAAGQPVYVMSTSVYPTFPLVNEASLPWPYHYHFLWPIPALYAGANGPDYRAPEQQDPREREFFDTVVTDLVRRPPRLLLVDRGTMQQAMRGRTFDFVEYFSAAPAFRLLLTRYTRLPDLGSWEIYRLEGDPDG